MIRTAVVIKKTITSVLKLNSFFIKLNLYFGSCPVHIYKNNQDWIKSGKIKYASQINLIVYFNP